MPCVVQEMQRLVYLSALSIISTEITLYYKTDSMLMFIKQRLHEALSIFETGAVLGRLWSTLVLVLVRMNSFKDLSANFRL